MKHGGRSLIVWECIIPKRVDPHCGIDDVMRKKDYLTILKENFPTAVDKMEIAGEKVICQHDNDPKNT